MGGGSLCCVPDLLLVPNDTENGSLKSQKKPQGLESGYGGEIGKEERGSVFHVRARPKLYAS